jgi:serine/threonine protein kinase
VWAIGVILFELCTFRKPFVGQTETELYQKITNEKIAQIPNLSTELMCLLKKMLNKNPNKRPTLREIIDMEYIRSKALLIKIDLPKKQA